MQFCIRDLREDLPPVALVGEVNLPDFVEGNVNLAACGDVTADLLVTFASRVCRVTGRLEAEVSYKCARCLETYQSEVKTRLDESFTQRKEKADDEIHWVDTDWVVLDPYIAEAMQLALEYRPLCRTDCKGLCPECGQDLNEGSCACRTDAVDPRLEALRDLLSAPESE